MKHLLIVLCLSLFPGYGFESERPEPSPTVIRAARSDVLRLINFQLDKEDAPYKAQYMFTLPSNPLVNRRPRSPEDLDAFALYLNIHGDLLGSAFCLYRLIREFPSDCKRVTFENFAFAIWDEGGAELGRKIYELVNKEKKA